MSKTRRRSARDFAAQRAKRNRSRSVVRKRNHKVVLDIETRSDLAFGGVELCPITGLPESIFSGHKT